MSDPTQKPTAIEQLVLYRMTSIEDALRELTQQVGRLVLIEERQSQTSAAVERAFSEIRAQDARIKTLELAQPITVRTNIWFERGLIAIAAAVGTVVLKVTLGS